MKISKVQITAAAAIAALLLGGCGAAPYELTKSEENIIVSYSSHIVSKYNTYQNEGLSWIDPESTEIAEEQVSETEPQETESLETGESAEGSGTAESGMAAEPQTATLNELFGMQGIQLDYVGARLTDSYVQDSYYAMNPDAGKVYLVLGIDITNTGEMDVEVDNLAFSPQFKVIVNDEVEASNGMTLLLEDFAYFQETLSTGMTKETVLLFQIPNTVTQIDSLLLEATVNGNTYQIIL